MWKHLLLGLKGNTTVVLGSNNTTIQDVSNSTININAPNAEQIKQALDDFWEHTKKKLYFVVYADFKNQNPAKWTPLGNRPILDIIQDCVNGLPQTKSVVWFIDSNTEIERETMADLKQIVSETILLFCSNSLKANRFYGAFDFQSIGGCIALPSCDIGQYETIFETISLYRSSISRIHNYKRTFKYALKHVCDDNDVAENINNIITAYMGHDYNSTASITPKNQSADEKPPTNKMPTILWLYLSILTKAA